MDKISHYNTANGFIQGPIQGLIKKHFGTFDVDAKASHLIAHLPSGGSYTWNIPSVSQFLSTFPTSLLDQSSFGHESPRLMWQLYKTRGSMVLSDSSIARNTSSGLDWREVQGIGHYEMEDNATAFENGFTLLSDMAVRVFEEQPARKFLLGFYLRSHLLEAWVYDRAGVYHSEPVDAIENSYEFLALVLAYQTLGPSLLGCDDILQTKNGTTTIDFTNGTSDINRQLYLEPGPLLHDKYLIGAGLTVYRAKTSKSADRWTHIVKLKWRRATDRAENIPVERAEYKCSWRPLLHQDYFTELAMSQNYFPAYAWQNPKELVKADSRDDFINTHGRGTVAYTKLITTRIHQERVLFCSITSPVGRSVQTFKSLSELFQVFHDVVCSHRSLFLEAGIMHRDISPGNIMIIEDPTNESKSRGLLIDFDQAIMQIDEPVNDEMIIGTRMFMSIGTLRGEDPSYQNDLEALFFLYIWLLITNGSGNLPDSSILCNWRNGTLRELSHQKSADMQSSRFGSILGEISNEYYSAKVLAQVWHDIIFDPECGERPSIPPDDDAKAIAEHTYSRIIEGLAKAIKAQDVVRE